MRFYSLKVAVLNRILAQLKILDNEDKDKIAKVPEVSQLMAHLLCTKEVPEGEEKLEWNERFHSECVHGEFIVFIFLIYAIWVYFLF